MSNEKMNVEQIRNLVSLLTITDKSTGATFMGIREYQSKSKLKVGEKHGIANYIVNTNISYENAKNHDKDSLIKLSAADIKKMAKDSKYSIIEIQAAIYRLLSAILKNENKETQSNQSKAQQDIYTKINGSVKFHEELQKVYIYSLVIDKFEISESVYLPKETRENTKVQNVVKKYCNFKTIKYRLFTIDVEQMTSVKINGEAITII